jgi:anti-sigma regulatory factor (Ser/Thr protein kinase)
VPSDSELVDAVHLALTAELASVPRARRAATAALERWGLDSLCLDAELVVSELVTNAILHGHAPIELAIRRRGGLVRVEVRDHSPAHPVSRRHRADAGTGRGLVLVASVATDWAVDGDSAGKVVWAELRASNG